GDKLAGAPRFIRTAFCEILVNLIKSHTVTSELPVCLNPTTIRMHMQAPTEHFAAQTVDIL
ncbi:MAG: hypothetical protein IJL40_04665, partial [Oscillospiraceae bacterium]|nr:hypothetical protein [Oscillospiraceae bacterium]